MVADLVNARGGAKLYTIKGTFGSDDCVRVARIMTPLLLRRARIHQRRTNDRFGLQPCFSPVHFAVTGSAI
jgi:hypothetical protein